MHPNFFSYLLSKLSTEPPKIEKFWLLTSFFFYIDTKLNLKFLKWIYKKCGLHITLLHPIFLQLSAPHSLTFAHHTSKALLICSSHFSGPSREARLPRPQPSRDFAEYKVAAAMAARQWCDPQHGGLACQKSAVAALLLRYPWTWYICPFIFSSAFGTNSHHHSHQIPTISVSVQTEPSMVNMNGGGANGLANTAALLGKTFGL